MKGKQFKYASKPQVSQSLALLIELCQVSTTLPALEQPTMEEKGDRKEDMEMG
jgi:hypothetical protein